MLARRIRRSPKLTLIALSVLLVLCTPALGRAYPATDSARAPETVKGQLVLLHSDDFQHGRSTNSSGLRTDGGRLLKVDLSELPHAEQLVGKRVRLVGERREGVFVAAYGGTTSDASAMETAQTTATTATTHQTAVILLNFTDDARQPWTPSAIWDLMFGASASVNAYYQEVSYGSTSFTGSVFGWVTIPYDSTSCDYWDWGNAAQQAAGVDPTKYSNIVFIWPQEASCGWGGTGTLLGKTSWINGYVGVRPLAHELGHNLGVHHAGSLECYVSGVRVTISNPETCDRLEYGDPFSVMGSSTRDWTNWNRGQLGWIPEMITITRAGTYTVAPAELGLQPRLLRVARGDGTYFYFEFRQPFGAFDNFSWADPVVNGVLVRLAPDKTTVAQSALLDMTPATSTRSDAALLVGQTFSDPVSGLSVTTTAVTPNGATISVSFGGGGGGTVTDTTAPTAPGNLTATATATSVSLAWTASTDNVGVSGYRILRDGLLVNTTTGTCYTDTGLVPGTAYLYSVEAYDAAGNSSTAPDASIATAPDTTAPKAPSNLKALVIGTTQVALSWVPATDDVSVPAYEIYRDGIKVGDTALPNWLDTGLAAGSTHKYQVLARDAAGNSSALSSAVSPRLLALSTATTGTLAGVVYNVLGRPQANVVVQLTGNGLAKSAKTGSSGTYKFGSLPPGSYTVTINRPAAATTASSSAALPTTVTSGATLVLVASP
jgi:chitodextrinase